ncbi:flagellar basal-body rod protein FlgG [Candidatus Thiodiazotropha endoloripes]|uniref:flagellar basal-body rod protein FlgG n=1 Tax=Candidatus Thiodiazotropha endoloripes TaxID=1818881 RepID=UPI00083DCF3A|nr:flagellar basal-body rod protein FlgG [Candidatus Thiodiazotropha endoloripes]ODB85646.1 flagellar basal-body rod protein FlgG [Candidatus Thiodiazotropha endoloripes]
MIESLSIGASGMHAQQTHIDVIANNLANVNTMGFKKSRVDFEDLMYKEMVRTANNGIPGKNSNKPLGVGVGISSTGKIFTTGEVKKTDRTLDMAIQGEGFFEVLLPDNSYAYTRNGVMRIDQDGYLSTSDGYRLSGMVQIPNDAEDLLFQADGKVYAQVSNSDDLLEIGALDLIRFVNASGLTPVGDNLYQPSDNSGDGYYGIPGEDGFGLIQQGFLETSNVDLVEEMTQLVLAQRAYEINSKVVQASDELLGIVNNLRR